MSDYMDLIEERRKHAQTRKKLADAREARDAARRNLASAKALLGECRSLMGIGGGHEPSCSLSREAGACDCVADLLSRLESFLSPTPPAEKTDK